MILHLHSTLFFQLLFLWSGMFILPSLHAELRVGPLFADSMVVQQKAPISVWGWGEPGEQVTVELGGQQRTGTVNAEGRWSLVLAPFPGGYEQMTLVVTQGTDSLIFHNVVVGEVWLCSGQSNMDFPMEALATPSKEEAYREVSDYVVEELRNAKDPFLRQISVPQTTSYTEPKEDFEAQWFSAVGDQTGKFSGTAYFFGRELRRELNVPVGLIKSSLGNTQVEAWMPESAFGTEEVLKERYKVLTERLIQNQLAYETKQREWQESGGEGRAPGLRQPPIEQKHNPATLYHAMIHPLIPYAIRGCIWYQGEANRFLPRDYDLKFSAMIAAWRKAWGIGDFPFYYVQLAGFQDPKREEGWIQVQNEQLNVLKENNVGMVVANDIGEAEDIHPRNKVDVGKRLAAWALANEYGVDLKAFTGPVYRRHEIEGNAILVSFDHTGSGLMTGRKNLLDPVRPTDEPLGHFELAGEEGQWKNAVAVIVSPDQVRVSHPEIPNPVHVRYAWASFPEEANLYNKEGFPGSLFSTFPHELMSK